MDARDLLLEEHSAVHSASVGGNKFSIADRTFAGLTDEQMRAQLASTQTYTLMVLKKTARYSCPEADAVIWEHGRRNFGLWEAG